MQIDLKLLENKVFSLVTLYKQLQHDNNALQEEIDALYKKNKMLEQKADEARKRIERLLANLSGAEHVG